MKIKFKLTLINCYIGKNYLNIEIIPNNREYSLFAIYYSRGTFIIDIFWTQWMVKQ